MIDQIWQFGTGSWTEEGKEDGKENIGEND